MYLLSIEKARFRRPVRAGEVMRLEVEPLRRGVALWRFAGTAYVDMEIAATVRLVGVGLPLADAAAFVGQGAAAR